MKKLQDQLKEVSKALTKLTKQVEKITDQAKKLEPAKKTRKAPAKKGKAAKAKAPAKKAAAKAPSKSNTVLDTVLSVIKRSKNGATVATLREKTSLNPRQISNALYKLSKRGSIEAKSRGLYVKK